MIYLWSANSLFSYPTSCFFIITFSFWCSIASVWIGNHILALHVVHILLCPCDARECIGPCKKESKCFSPVFQMFNSGHCSRKGAVPVAWPQHLWKSVELVQYTYELGVNTLILLENEISLSLFLAKLTSIMVRSLFHIFKVSSLKMGCVFNCLTCVVQISNI